MKNKRGISMPQEFTGWFMWGIIILVFFLMIYLILKGKLTGMIDFIKGALRFGRG